MGNKNRFYVDVMALHKEVTGSCILNTIKYPDGSTEKVLIDCGLFQEEKYLDLNKSFPFNESNIDHVIITHNHVDHTGRLPLLVKNGYRGKIHMSYDTSVLIPGALYDSSSVLRKKAKLNNEAPLYTDSDVDMTLGLISPHTYEESFWLNDSNKDKNIKVTFFMNGHLPGAVIILMQIRYHDKENPIYDDINLLYTGDYNNVNAFFDVSPIPKWVHQLPISIIQESTYGNTNSNNIEHVFENNILQAVSEGKEIAIPVLSLQRMQEVMYVLRKLQDSGKLSTDIPIYCDGKLGIKFTKIYSNKALSSVQIGTEFLPNNLIFVTDKTMREDVLSNSKCKIILTTSGMGSFGPAQFYLPILLKRPNALIHFTSYLAEGTLGRRLLDYKSRNVVNVYGLQIKILADIKFTFEISAHAKSDVLLDFLRPFENIKMVLINHGDTFIKESYAEQVMEEEINCKDIGILSRDYVFRLNAYGLARTPLSAKL